MSIFRRFPSLLVELRSKTAFGLTRQKVSSNKGAFLVIDNCVFYGPLGHSLRSFTCTAHSAHSLRSATLASLARSIHGLVHSLRSLPRGTVEIHEYLKTAFGLTRQKVSSNKGAFLVIDNCVFYGPLGHSLRSFTCTAHSAHSLRSATLASLARSIHGLVHSLRSLPRGTVEIHEYVFML